MPAKRIHAYRMAKREVRDLLKEMSIMREKEYKEGSRKDFFSLLRDRGYGVVSVLSYILVPVCILAVILFCLLTEDTFYTGIIRNADLIRNFIHSRNWQMEEPVRQKIEDEVQLESFKKEFDRIRLDFDSRRAAFESINKADKYDSLKRRLEELTALTWERAPKVFRNKARFEDYRKQERRKLESRIEDIEKYREKKSDAIKTAASKMKEAEEAFRTARDTLHKKEERARNIALSYNDSFMSKIYSDAEILNKPLTAELNARLVDGAVKNEIDKTLRFMTSYDEQVVKGNVFRDRFTITEEGIADTLKIQFPRLSVSLWVNDSAEENSRRRHLLSDVFVEVVQKQDGLQKKDLFVNFFKLSETALADAMSDSFLKKNGISLRQGVISLKPVVFTGHKARRIESVMKFATFGNYLRFILLAVAFVFLAAMFLYPVDRLRKKRNIRRLLLYPSIGLILLSLLMIGLSGFAIHLFPEAILSAYMIIYIKKMLLVVAAHLFVPVIIAYSIIALSSLLFRERAAMGPEIQVKEGGMADLSTGLAETPVKAKAKAGIRGRAKSKSAAKAKKKGK
jgi:hypothetical protein